MGTEPTTFFMVRSAMNSALPITRSSHKVQFTLLPWKRASRKTKINPNLCM